MNTDFSGHFILKDVRSVTPDNEKRLARNILFCIFFALSLNFLKSEQVVINEIMSANASTVADEDGDYTDWIELYNVSAEKVSLNTYWLSDDPSDIFKWHFPDISVEPDGHLLIFASDKDRYDFWDTVVDWGDVWKYRPGDSEPPSNWNTLSFNDSQWFSGSSGFGYGDGDDSTIIDRTLSLYARIVFSVEDVDTIRGAILHIDFDDAFVAYLNGIEIARANIGDHGYRPAHNATADEPREATIYQGGLPEAYPLDEIDGIIRPGQNVLAIQVHNSEINSSDLTLIPFLTLRLSSLPDEPISVADILRLPSILLHTNFKIKSSGEVLILADPDGNIADSISTGVIPTDISRGRYPDGGTLWMLFPDPTPGSGNMLPGYVSDRTVKAPEFSPERGFYSDIMTVSLTSESPASTITYTLDGSVPDESSSVYQGPVQISENTVIRARSFESGLLPSRTVTHTYFINAAKSLPVFSLSTDPDNLWGEENGIYMNITERWEWEKPLHVEFFESDGQSGFSMDAGVEIYGWGGSFFEQKSLAIYARGIYGYPELNYRLFPDLDINVFEAFILRNSGNDWWSTLFRDALTTGLMKGTEVDFQAYRPSVVYLNGEYWGIHNIREKINEHFVAAHHNADPGDLDFLEHKEKPEVEIHHGDAEHYYDMREFMSNHSLEDQDNYQYAATLLDIDNFIDYQIGEIYCANLDWPANNNKFWRPRSPGGRWRWIMYDTDVGFSLWDDIWDDSPSKGWGLDFIAHATEDEQSWGYPEDWPNAPWSTLLFRRLLENESFRNEFINRFADYLNSRFHPDAVLRKIDELQQGIEPEIPAHVSRWDRTVDDWKNEVAKVKTFASLRPTFVRRHIVSHFDLSGTAEVTVNVTPPKRGTVQVNSMTVGKYPWKGVYFRGIPIQLKAKPAPGFEFVGWVGIHPSGNSIITVNPKKDMILTASFQPHFEFASSVVINEINYNDAADFDAEDWVELHNPTETPVNVSGWVLKDSDDTHEFSFPENSTIGSAGYLVVCRDTDAFTRNFPEVSNYLGEFNFGLSSTGDQVRLYDADMDLVDSVAYGVDPPWPTAPNGQGPTLALANPHGDNTVPDSWVASDDHGSPGAGNGEITVAIPQGYELLVNYPNPFNTNTLIRFSIPEPTRIVLKVYDLKGREVATLLEEDRPPGDYEVIFDRPDLPSGVYFYRLEAGEFVKNRKMMFIK